MTNRRLLTGLLAALLGLGAGVFALMGTAGAGSGAAVGVIDTFDRARVLSSWQTHVEQNVDLNSGWNGSVDGCRAGNASAAFDGGTLETINWFRRMAGLPTVAENTAASVGAQQAALMMDAANRLSHSPATSWPCHTAAGAGAAGTGNLTLGVAGARGVIGQIEDPGAGNEILGHRRWLLYPRLGSVGIGNTSTAGVVTVIGAPTTRASGTQWISWPPAGYVPADAVYDRWSLSWNNETPADFSKATVTMTENGRSVGVTMLPLVNGYGDATLGWEPNGISPNQGGDVKYRITVSNIIVNGRSVTRTWETVAIGNGGSGAIALTGANDTCAGHRATIVGTNGDDVLYGTPGNDVIVAGDGSDVVYGGGGNDIICGGTGNDNLYGEAGNDSIWAGTGNDNVRGGTGDDMLDGMNGRDRLLGNEGSDLLIGGGKRDVIMGNSGSDICWPDRAGSSSSSSDALRSCN